MGWQTVHGFCGGCRRFFSFNATHVPSIRVGDSAGGLERVPLCRGCFGKWNDLHRISKGLQPEPLHPQAYEPEEVA